MKFLEEKFMPVAAKIGQQKHLAAIRDSFALIMPFIIAGAFAVLFNNVVFKTDVDFSLAKLFAPNGNGKFFTDIYIVPIFGLIFQGTLAVMGLLVSFGIGYYLSLSKGSDNPAFAGLLSTVTTLMLSSWTVMAQVVVKGGKAVAFDPSMTGAKPTSISVMALDPASVGATGLFATIIFGIIAVETYLALNKVKSFEIKMPASVPPAVSKSFSALIPGMLTLIIVGVIGVVLTKLTNETSVFALVAHYVQQPFMAMANSGVGGIILAFIYVFFTHLLWSFGLHGANIMNGIFSAIYQPLVLKNMELYSKHGRDAKGLSTFVQPFFEQYIFLGGSGATLGLLIAIFVASKKEEERTVAKLSFAPGCFEINEPVIFGLPIVLNPSYIIPFILAPVANLILAWTAIDLIHFAPKIVATVPWTTPPVIGAFIASGFAWQSIIVACVLIVVDFFIYLPFVKSSTKRHLSEVSN